jgi:CRP-like cAMP-binding protein
MTRRFGNKSGHTLFNEGERSDFVYRLASGRVEITRRVPGGSTVVGEIRPGEFIGEMGVLVACPRSGTARLTADSEVEQFTRNEFLDFISKDAAMSARLLDALSLRTRSQVELLKQLPDLRKAPKGFGAVFRHRLKLLADWLHEVLRARLKSVPFSRGARAVTIKPGLPERIFKKGSHLFEEGEPSDQLFWIRSGRVHIVKRMEGGVPRQIGVAGKNEFIGEMGTLESLPRSASALAVTDVAATVISQADFLELVQTSPSAYFIVIDSLCERANRLRRVIRRLSAAHGISEDAGESIFEIVRSVDSVAQLAQQRLVDETLKVRRFFHVQLENGKYIKNVYQKSLRREASKEELERANAYFRDYLKMAGIGTLLVLPGAPLTIPLAVKIGKAMGVDILPGEGAEPKMQWAGMER